MISQWDIIISGFRQTRAERTGCEILWQQMLQRVERPGLRRVCYLPWNSDWAAEAAFIARVSVARPGVRVYAYSWGVGWGTVQLATELGKLGIAIDHVVSCDGVYRSKILPAWVPANVVSLLSFPEIRMPANVARVDWSYQRVDTPAGHRIVAEDRAKTTIARGVQRPLGHLRMDEDFWWHDRSLEVARTEELAA